MEEYEDDWDKPVCEPHRTGIAHCTVKLHDRDYGCDREGVLVGVFQRACRRRLSRVGGLFQVHLFDRGVGEFLQVYAFVFHRLYEARDHLG